MKTRKNFYSLSVMLVTLLMLAVSSCKKDEMIEEGDYIPVFSSTSIAIDATTIDFYITCSTDDYELVKVIVTEVSRFPPLKSTSNSLQHWFL